MSKNELLSMLRGIYRLGLSLPVVDQTHSYRMFLLTVVIRWVFEPLSIGRKNELFPYLQE